MNYLLIVSLTPRFILTNYKDLQLLLEEALLSTSDMEMKARIERDCTSDWHIPIPLWSASAGNDPEIDRQT